jgi:formylglycine-generating enzyme
VGRGIAIVAGMLASCAAFGCGARWLSGGGHGLAAFEPDLDALDNHRSRGSLRSAISKLAMALPAVQASQVHEFTSPRAEGAGFVAAINKGEGEGEGERAAATRFASSGRCPAEMALIEGRVCVDRWEASLVERLSDGLEHPWSPYQSVEKHEHTVRAVSRPGSIPQGYISGKQAQTACVASGKRLCTGAEWERACRGPAHTQFPYGQERRAGACNDDIRSTHPVAEVVHKLGLAREAVWGDAMNQPLVNQLPGTVSPAGERAECTNDYGVFDMVGNLHEWVDDAQGTFRGGYYMDTSHNGEGCAYATTAHDFDYHDYSTGFRCCADPDRAE